MDRLAQRLISAEKTFTAFEEVMRIVEPDAVIRDATIQRFEFTFEAIWKLAKETLYVQDGIDIGSPKGVIRACREVGVLDQEQAQLALLMVDDRNLTVHTYNEVLAVEIFSHLPSYFVLMKLWLQQIRQHIQ
jgi:nucleotidyltransferase substrate binding protein (TIGR01987 family)